MTDFGDELHGLLAERRSLLREAARRAGCSAGYLSNVAHGRKPLTPSVAARLDRVSRYRRNIRRARREAGTRSRRDAQGTELAQVRPDSLPRSVGCAGMTTIGQPTRSSTARSVTTADLGGVFTAAKHDTIQLWRNELDESGTPAGTRPCGERHPELADGATRGRGRIYAAGDKVIFQPDVKRVRAVRAWLKDLDNAHGGGVAFPLAVAYLRGEVAPLLRGS